jgi:uncharacterized lipoprotein YddW (UPF0748 family)
MHQRFHVVLGKLLVWLLFLVMPASSSAAPPPESTPRYLYKLNPANFSVPAPRAEFRGVWIATVDNTDWPSAPGMSTAAQQTELITLLDRAASLHLNAVLLQVRPSCDALYQSSLEPWSTFLVGPAGQAPHPFYDPLAFAIQAAHQRGLELHAWINPFRVRSKKDKSPARPDGVAIRHPEWVRRYGDVEWLDPGIPAVRQYSLAVIHDIVSRYDIDGIHIDDYFYPYPQQDDHQQDIPFPDKTTFIANGNGKALGDWRRNNINEFVHAMYDQTKATKRWVKVGISPFGIWRPGNPEQIGGFDAYEKIYADSRLWMREGWADYFSPQLYWKIENPGTSFPVLLAWWISQNMHARHLWPGLYTIRAQGPDASWAPSEIEYQIKTVRGIAGADGEIHYSGSFLNTPAPEGNLLYEHLQSTVYQQPAIVPATPWLAPEGIDPPQKPASISTAASGQAGLIISWGPAPQDSAHHARAAFYVVQWETGSGKDEKWQLATVPASGALKLAIPSPDVGRIAVRGVDRTGCVGSPEMVLVQRQRLN